MMYQTVSLYGVLLLDPTSFSGPVYIVKMAAWLITAKHADSQLGNFQPTTQPPQQLPAKLTRTTSCPFSSCRHSRSSQGLADWLVLVFQCCR